MKIVIRLIFELTYFTLVNQAGTARELPGTELGPKSRNSTGLAENFLKIEFVSKVMSGHFSDLEIVKAAFRHDGGL